MAEIYTSARWVYEKNAAGRTDQDWADAYAAAESDERTSESLARLGAQLDVPEGPWHIWRCIISFNIPSGLGSIAYALLISQGVYCDEPGGVGGFICKADDLPGTKADYGLMLGLSGSDVLGTWAAPNLYDQYSLWFGAFNSDGLAYLTSKINGTANLALYSPDKPATPYQRIFVQVGAINTDAKTRLIVNELAGGYIWVEGTNFAYLDVGRNKRLEEGALTGTTGKIAGHHWVEGDYLHYIDNTGAERRILGSATGLTGKQPGQLSLNTKNIYLGTYMCYIDSSGNERCFEGST